MQTLLQPGAKSCGCGGGCGCQGSVVPTSAPTPQPTMGAAKATRPQTASTLLQPRQPSACGTPDPKATRIRHRLARRGKPGLPLVPGPMALRPGRRPPEYPVDPHRPSAVARRGHPTVSLAGVSAGGPDPHRDSALVASGRILWAPPSPPGATGAAGALPGGPTSRPLTLAWRDTEVTLPRAFYLSYLSTLNALRAERSAEGRGAVSSVSSALDTLWPEVRAAAAAAGAYGDRARETWRGMLQCYNLPRETWVAEMTAKGDDYRPMFWMAEWGAPFEVYCRIMQLVRTYADTAQDHVSRSSACDGFSTWLRRAVMGEPVDNAVVSAPCRVGIQFINADADTAYNPSLGGAAWVSTCSVGGIELPTATGSCAAGYYVPVDDEDEDDVYEAGRPWDDWEAMWDATDAILRPDRADAPHHYYPYNAADSSAHVPLGRGLVLVRLHPTWLAWYGYVVDHLLFLARITVDYARWAARSLPLVKPKYEALLDTARRFARYALRLLVPCAELMIHELGHIYAGGGHCDWAKYPSTNDCCFGMAGARFTCFVTQALGLPPNEVEGPYVGASPPGRFIDNLWECMFDTTVLLACRVQCDVLDPGAIGGGAHLCTSPCAGPAHYRCEVLT